MASQEEFGALLKQANGGEQEWMKSWAANQQQQSPPRSRPPSNHNGGYRRKSNDGAAEQSPLLPQSVLAVPQLPPTSAYDQLNSSSRSMNPKQQRHGRSRSELPGQYGTGAHPPVDPTHPFNKGISPPAPIGGNSNRFNRPPRANSVVTQQSVVSPQSPVPYSGVNGSRSKPMAHRRAKSDIPLAMFGSGGSSINGRRIITKEDLLKNLPSPRWGGAPKPMHTRNRSRTGSDGPLMLSSDNASVSSGGGGPYGYGSISNVELGGEPKNPVRHQRLMSGASMQSIDASVKSVTTNMAKSALFKGVTDTGRIRLQLPKDSFRILMDCQLEAGSVYKRALVEDEDKFFVEFHEEEVHDDLDPNNACHCTCDGCNRCHEKQKRLPPDLYVMAVDSTIYRRMLDEVIESRDMPCGTFFCGHHEDVRHPDITIAALIVALVFFILCALTWLFP